MHSGALCSTCMQLLHGHLLLQVRGQRPHCHWSSFDCFPPIAPLFIHGVAFIWLTSCERRLGFYLRAEATQQQPRSQNFAMEPFDGSGRCKATLQLRVCQNQGTYVAVSSNCKPMAVYVDQQHQLLLILSVLRVWSTCGAPNFVLIVDELIICPSPADGECLTLLARSLKIRSGF